MKIKNQSFNSLTVIKLVMIFCLAELLFSQAAYAQTVSVGVEPMPPFINQDGTGHTITLLKQIEKVSTLKFDITVMPYNRAKIQLDSGNIDMIAHTPYGNEEKAFYNYAQELTFKIDVVNDIYAIKKEYLDNPEKAKIGVPRGNKEFLSEVTGIPIDHFYETDLQNLPKMLESERIDAMMFERNSAMKAIKNANVSNVLYRQMPKEYLPVGIAVRKDSNGTAIRTAFEAALKKIDLDQIFTENNQALKLPSNGIVK